MSPSNLQNELFLSEENGPNDDLDHSVYGRGKWIHPIDLEKLEVTKYRINKKGITYTDLVSNFGIAKTKAQRRLKNACFEMEKNGKKSSILFTLDKRTKPQQYYPSCIKAEVIEDVIKKQNRLIGTTGVSYSNKGQSSYYPLHNAIENQIVSSFLTELSLLPFQPLNLHNIHLWTIIDNSHYEEINQSLSINKTKIKKERIGLRDVVYKFNKRGSIEIIIACSKYPFPIETDDDVNDLFVFLGKVQYTLAYILSDPRERIVPPVDKWILKYCDFNKDVEIIDKNIGQLLGLNIQIKHVGKAFRLYVKNLEDRFVLREERTMKVDQSITTFMNDSILHPYHLIKKEFDELKNIILEKLNEKN